VDEVACLRDLFPVGFDVCFALVCDFLKFCEVLVDLRAFSFERAVSFFEVVRGCWAFSQGEFKCWAVKVCSGKLGKGWCNEWLLKSAVIS